MPALKSFVENFKVYGVVAAGGLRLMGGRAPSGPLPAPVGICDPCNHENVFCWHHPPGYRVNDDTTERSGGSGLCIMPLDLFKGRRRSPLHQPALCDNLEKLFEIQDMIEVRHKVGDEEAQFAYGVAHQGAQGLARSPAQLKELHTGVLPAARAQGGRSR